MTTVFSAADLANSLTTRTTAEGCINPYCADTSRYRQERAVNSPRILESTPPHGFTQYTDADGDYLTFGEITDDTERRVYGIVAAVATPNPDGIGLTAHQARDLARRLLMAADPGLTPTMRGIHCTLVSASGQNCIFGLGHAVDYHLDQQGARWSDETARSQS